MFIRSKDRPLVSFLLPSRGRPKWLCEAIDSIYSLATDKSCMEFILKVDDDDNETISVATKLSSLIPIKILISPKGNGYHEMHHWINNLSAIATGDWLFIMNDDARFTTEDWDGMLSWSEPPKPWHGCNDVALFLTPTITRPDANEFFFLRRKVYEILGHFSLSPHNDTWMFKIMQFVDSTFTFSQIEIDHFSDIAKDDTRKESVEAYKTTISTLTSKESKRARLADATKLLNYILNYEETKV
jgi:hypothetical protein